MKKQILKHIWWVTFILSLVLLAVHSLNLITIKVDSTSILLLIIMLISPFVTTIKKIKYGDFEAEIDPKEIQKIKSDVEKNVNVKPSEEESQPESFTVASAIKELAVTDPVIALAKIRIELEKILNRLARSTSIETKRTIPLGRLVNILVNHEVISQQIGKSLSEVISICNRAIHGEYISEENTNTIIDISIELIENLHWSVQEQTTSGSIIEEKIISTKESEGYYEDKRYKLTTVIPLVTNPKKIVRHLTQEQLNDFLEGYQEYAEFIVELVEVPSNG